MAAPPTPLPRRARAVIVGIESYALQSSAAESAAGNAPTLESTTRIPDLQGVVDDALRLAASLQADMQLAAGDIDLWLNPASAAAAATPAGTRVHAFTREGFEDFIDNTLAQDAAGGLLLLFWSGHGVIDDHIHLRLLLPGSTIRKPRDYDADDICSLLLGADLAQFSHQVIVFNACRVTAVNAGVEGRLNKTQLAAEPPDAARRVAQLKVYGCSLAESSRQPKDGALLLRALRAQWRAAGRDPWPDFEQLALAAADQVAADTDAEQRPQVIGWAGNTLMAPTPSLLGLLGQLQWLTEDFRALALRCLRAQDRRARFADLAAIVSTLDDLPAVADVRPIHEFVARVLGKADAAAPAGLHDWFKHRTSDHERAEIARRLQADPPLHVLQLWVQDEPRGVSAALLDSQGRVLRTDWDIRAARAFDPADPASLLAVLGGWLEKALARVGPPLLLELFLPTVRLAAGIDGCTVTAGGDDYVLGVELPAFLRALDRHKSPKRRNAWSTQATSILGRYVSTTRLLHWSTEPVSADLMRSEFAVGHAAGAVWLGLQGAPAPAATAAGVRVLCAFDHALDSGVPSMLWQRNSAAALPRQALDTALRELLNDAASNLPRTLRDWRALHAATLCGEPALLLDDPARPPPWTQAFGLAGGPTP